MSRTMKAVVHTGPGGLDRYDAGKEPWRFT